MAATEPICFAEPAQLGGSSFGSAALYLNSDLSPLWRYACLPVAVRQPLQVRELRR